LTLQLLRAALKQLWAHQIETLATPRIDGMDEAWLVDATEAQISPSYRDAVGFQYV
jgi:hypothetical protein